MADNIEKICRVKPDIILPRYKTAVFVHGCFWHMDIIANSSACQLQTRSIGKKRLDATN